MEDDGNRIAPYKMIADAEGNCYCFFCELSGMVVCITEPICSETSEEEAFVAWKRGGIQYFNQCQKCGKWVSNSMYNPDTLKCVLCSPWEDYPTYCPYCGAAVRHNNEYCYKCGYKLQYGGGITH